MPARLAAAAWVILVLTASALAPLGEVAAWALPPHPLTPSPQVEWGHGVRLALAADPIRVLDQGYENHFPTNVRFTLRVEGDAPITKVTVYFKEDDQAITSYAPATFRPGHRISAEHVLDLRRFYTPPGVAIRYQWRVEDEAGRRLVTDWESFVLEDPRFQWQIARAENVELRWYRGGDAFGQALLDPARRALQKLRTEAGAEVGRTIKIYIYGSEADFQSAVDPGTHEWAGGRAFPREGVILIATPPGSLDFARRTVPHELSHVVVYQATRNPYGGLPTWLDEGLAMLAEGDLQPSFARALQTAIREDRLISAWALSSSFPTDPRLAELSYAESYSLVKFVVGRYGQAGLSRLLAQFREGATYDDALQAALGVDTYGLDDAWRASLGLAPALAATPAASPSPMAAAPARLPGATPTAAPGLTTLPAIATTVVSGAPSASPPSPTAVALAPFVATATPTGGATATCAAPVAFLMGGGALAAFARGRRGG